MRMFAIPGSCASAGDGTAAPGSDRGDRIPRHRCHLAKSSPDETYCKPVPRDVTDSEARNTKSPDRRAPTEYSRETARRTGADGIVGGMPHRPSAVVISAEISARALTCGDSATWAKANRPPNAFCRLAIRNSIGWSVDSETVKSMDNSHRPSPRGWIPPLARTVTRAPAKPSTL